MSQNSNHINTVLGLFFKGALLVYFACFFLGGNVVINFLSSEDCSYELYEEMETEDTEEEKEVDNKEKELEDKIRDLSNAQILSNQISLIQIEAWNRALFYEGFKREIPDPPPEA